MFQTATNHFCTIQEPSGKTQLPKLPRLPPGSKNHQKLLRFLKKALLITELNPRSIQFFRSTAEIIAERTKHIESGSWIIHPFSTFRLYYEMYMAVVFFVCLFYFPSNVAFEYLSTGILGDFLDCCCLLDMVVTFRTGYKFKERDEVVMMPKKIARRYLLSIYFPVDLLSSIPNFQLGYNDIFNYLALLKIFRMGTFIKYAGRTFYYYKLQGFFYQVAIILIIAFFISHYFACCVKFLHNVYRVHENDSYIVCFYKGTAIFLGIDYNFPKGLPYGIYVALLVGYFLGKICLTFATVIALDLLKASNSLENKYFAMMSQVDAYMAAKRIPHSIQKRMREYYQYKYRQKYFKESSIKKFISESLNKEITYHSCRKLVENVQMFERLPQRVLEDILTFMKVEIYLTSDVIIQSGSVGDCMYFIASGTVAVYSPSGKEICHLEDGAYFGEIALVFTGQKRTASVVAIEICEVYRLDRKSFKKCMESNNELLWKIQEEAEKRLTITREIESTFMKEFSTKF